MLVFVVVVIACALAFGVYETRRIFDFVDADIAQNVGVLATFWYVVLVLASLLFMVLAWILAPLLALTCDAQGNLPVFLRWFQTQDNTCDAGWKVQGNYGTYLTDGTVPTGATLWWYRTLWLWRNPGYGFDYGPLGVAVDTTQWRVVQNDSAYFVALGPRGKFCIKSGGDRPMKLGWKIWAYWDDTTNAWRPDSYTWGPRRRTSICFTPEL